MRFLAFIATATLALALVSSTRAAGSADSFSEVRAEFQQAFARAAKSDSDAADSERLKSYPLYAYLQAERIRKALAPNPPVTTDVDERAAAFLATHDRMPVARRVRRAWLESLAQREQ